MCFFTSFTSLLYNCIYEIFNDFSTRLVFLDVFLNIPKSSSETQNNISESMFHNVKNKIILASTSQNIKNKTLF